MQVVFILNNVDVMTHDYLSSVAKDGHELLRDVINYITNNMFKMYFNYTTNYNEKNAIKIKFFNILFFIFYLTRKNTFVWKKF